MKKIFAILIFAALLLSVFAGCSNEPQEPEVPENEQISEEFSEPEEVPTEIPEEPSEPEKTFFPASAAYTHYGESYIDGKKTWNEDGTLTFQHENTLNTISVENELLKTVILPKEYLPEDGGYDLFWNDKYILAVDRQQESSWEHYGVACFDKDGTAHLANVALFDIEGNLIKEYNKGATGRYDENGEYEMVLPDSRTYKYPDHTYLADGQRTYWISEDEVVFECHLWIIYYNFSKDEGRVLDNMSEFGDKYGKFCVYYGADSNQCGVLDGSFYYLAHKNDEKGNGFGTVWKANGNGAEELFGGTDFWHFFVGKEILIAVEGIDESYYENGSIVYAIDPETLELKEIFRGDAAPPFCNDGQIRFRGFSDEPTVLYSYDYKTGEFSEDVGNTEFVIYSFVPGHREYVMRSPDGKYFVEYNTESEIPEIRISIC